MLSDISKSESITIWGKGREGTAVADFIRREFPSCRIKTVEDPLTEPLSGIVVKSPGISLYRDEIRNSSAVFTSGTNLFLEKCYESKRRPFLIGVTGTKGKSTTSSLIAHLLSAQGRKVALGGNIGEPVIGYAGKIDSLDVVVDEISSYQAADLQYSFDVCVILNLYPEHIDWHRTHDRYYRDKLNIQAHRMSGQKAVLNKEDARTKEYLPSATDAVFFNDTAGISEYDGWFWKSGERLFETSVVPLKGEHNLKNVCAALTAVELAGGDLKACAQALKTFKALPHRLSFCCEKGGVCFIDDSISTTPETAIAALKAFAPQPIILIAGGYDRCQDYKELASFIASGGAKAVVTLPDTGERLARDVLAAGGKAYETSNMREAVLKAFSLAHGGDIVLLSPASPSYGIYKNFEERGDLFAKEASEL